jgi:hypothetical protein
MINAEKFIKKVANSFVYRGSHDWNEMPRTVESEIFIYNLLRHYCTQENTPFVVSSTTFSELRNKNQDDLKAVRGKFYRNFLNGEGFKCSFSHIELSFGSKLGLE